MNAPRHRLRAVDRELTLGEGAGGAGEAGGPLIMGIVNASPDSFSDGISIFAVALSNCSTSGRNTLLCFL